jgi:hypothetical protein
MSLVVYSGKIPEYQEAVLDVVRYVFRADGDDFGLVDEILRGGGLFTESRHVILYDFLGNKDAWLFFKKNIAAWLESGHAIELREEKLLAEHKKLLTKLGAEVIETKAPKKPKDNTVFAITDAVLVRDRKKAWLNYRAAIDAGKSPEEIVGLLWWQIKTLWLVAKLGDKSGQAPYGVGKARQALKKYSSRDVAIAARSLVEVYHLARLGEGPELEGACEKWLLGI